MAPVKHAPDRQRESTLVNASQMTFPVVAQMPRPVFVPDALLDKCETRLAAIRLCIELSNFSHDMIRDRLGIDKGHFSRMLSGRANFDERKIAALMELCGNLAPLQWEAKRMGYALVLLSQIVQEQPATRHAPWMAA